MVSVARTRLEPRKSARPFKRIICADISEFESSLSGRVGVKRFQTAPSILVLMSLAGILASLRDRHSGPPMMGSEGCGGPISRYVLAIRRQASRLETDSPHPSSLRGHRSTGSAEFSFLLSLLCTTETRHDERHKCALMARSLVCSVALSGQVPKPHSGAPQARGLTANARTEQTSVLPRCAPTIGRSQSCRRSFFSAPAKLGSIHPHAMHDDSQPSRHSDDCALHPTMPGNLHAPGLEPRPLAAVGHQHQGCLEQHLAHHGVSAFRDAAHPVDLA